MTTLYAWVNPVSWDTRVDHTWVTTYPTPNPPYPDIQAVVAAGESYWFCWGIYHPQGNSATYPGGAIGNQAGDLSVATCICQANVKTSSHKPGTYGTIQYYAIDGVCHQLANQVLYATATSGTPPLTVHLARGYRLSTWLYGTYGRRKSAWAALVQKCTGAGVSGDAEMFDDFIEHAAETLGAGFDAARRDELLALREQFQQEVESRRPQLAGERPEEAAAQINGLIEAFRRRAEEILGPEDYERVFELPAGEPVRLADPAMVEASWAGEGEGES